MNPDWAFERQSFEKSHSLRQRLSKPLSDEAAEEKVGTYENEKKCEQNIIG
ncbi:MAG: hypothetical protein ACXU9L_06050 [Thermodesulfobacteriota bacterium]